MQVPELTEKLYKEASRKSTELSRRIFDEAVKDAWEDGFREGMNAAHQDQKKPSKRRTA
jgi:hypothetical protein